MSDNNVSRRTMLRATGLTVVGAAFAGCGGSDSSGDDDGGDDETTDDEEMSPAAETEQGGMEAPSEVSEYLSEVSNFDGTLTDMTDQSEVTVEVGAPGNDGNYAFEPAAVQISTGTTVMFEWTGEGGAHNVVAEDETFDSGSSVSGSGVNFEYTFEETGSYNYYCTPHKALNMKGSIVVV